jgi:hypothetical protein
VLQHIPYPPDPSMWQRSWFPAWSTICKQGGHCNSSWCGVALISVSGDAHGVWHLPHCWKQTTDKPIRYTEGR